MVRRASRAWWAALVVVGAATAQEARIAIVAPRFAAAERGSSAWFDQGFELIEAQLDVDVKQALATAMELWDLAEDSAIRGVPEVASVMVGLVTASLEGPLLAQPWFSRAMNVPTAAAPSLRARYWMSRARVLCCAGNHAEEMQCAVPGKAAADEAMDHVLRVRAMALTAHIAPERGLSSLQKIFDEAEAAGVAAEVVHMRPLLKIEQRDQALQRGDVAMAERLNDELHAEAMRLGHRRLHAFVTVNRANRHYEKRERDEAIALFEQVAAMYTQLGDRRPLFGVRNMLAWTALHREDLDTAEARIEQNRALIEDRGFAADEKELLRIRFDLAVRRRDADLAAELKRQFERHDAAFYETEQRTSELRERVRAAEAERELIESRLAAEQGRARTLGGLGLVVALSLLVAISWRARRRLLVANGHLAEQVRRVEEGRVAQAKLEERMRELERTESLGTMAAGVAHDFNNLLTSILGSAELLQRHERPAEAQELAHTIQLAGEQAARLCRQLQAYAGGSPMQLAPLDLGRLALEMRPALAAATHGAVVVAVQAPPTPVGALGDRAQIEQVLLNLVVNARDAGAQRVTIQVHEIVPMAAAGPGDEEPRQAGIVVSDDGEGMTPEVQQRIFDPFFTTRFPGRGLGLAVVHGVVRRHAGRIAVASAPGQGSTFTLALPSALVPPGVVEIPRPEPAAPLSPGRGLLVVVDDDPSVREMLSRMMLLLGQQACIVDHGEAAIDLVAKAATDQPVLMLVDLTMPDIDGVEVVRRVRALRADARVVLMSGHPVAYVEQVAGDLRPDGVLGKPFRLDAVRTLLVRLAAAPAAPAVAPVRVS